MAAELQTEKGRKGPIVATRSTPQADAIGWRAISVTGNVASRPKNQIQASWKPIHHGQVLQPDTEVRTGEDGFVVLFNGSDLVSVKRDGQIFLPGHGSPERDVTVVQTKGRAHYKVKSRRYSAPLAAYQGAGHANSTPLPEPPPGLRFQVRTPYLLAVVKGTSFDVGVTAESATVSVSEGVVGVTDTSSGSSADVAAGQSTSAGQSADASSAGASGANGADGAGGAGGSGGGAGGSGGGAGGAGGSGGGAGGSGGGAGGAGGSGGGAAGGGPGNGNGNAGNPGNGGGNTGGSGPGTGNGGGNGNGNGNGGAGNGGKK